MFLWVACTNLIEWRGAGIPKIVLKKSGPNMDELRQERELDQRNDSAETSNLNEENGTNAIWNYFRGPNGDGIYPNKAVLTDWPEKAHRFFGGNWWAEVTPRLQSHKTLPSALNNKMTMRSLSHFQPTLDGLNGLISTKLNLRSISGNRSTQYSNLG